MAAESSLQYLKVDYASHKAALLQRVRSRWPLIWNDFTSNSFGMVIVDLISWSTATIAFLINRAAAENFITTMTLRESAVRLGALVGYELRGSTPAVVMCEAEISAPAASSVKISKGTLIRAGENSVPFEVAQDYTIEAGNRFPETQILVMSVNQSGSKIVSSDIVVTNGSKYADLVDTTVDLSQLIQVGQSFRVLPSDDVVYSVTSIESAPGAVSNNRIVLDSDYAGTSTQTSAEIFDRRIALVQGQTLSDRFVAPAVETTNYSVQLKRSPIIDGSISVQVNGEPWTQASSLVEESSTSKTFRVKTLATGQTLVEFGDGQFGTVIPTDGVVIVTYRVGGGEQGNISTNTVNTSVTGIVTALSSPVTVVLSNRTSSGQGGREVESLEEARVGIPYFIRTNDRAVTLDDWQTIAQRFTHPQFGSVAYARASVRTENALLEGNIVTIYAWTTGDSGSLVALNSSLKTALKEYLQTKAVGTDYVVVYDGTDRPVPVSLRFKTTSGFDAVETKSLVDDTIRSFIAVLRPGQPLVYSDFLRKLDEVYGVDSVNMATPIADLIASNPTELFTAPDDDYEYTIEIEEQNSSISYVEYSAQLPVTPLQSWSFTLSLDGVDLLVVPYSKPGFARVIGTGIYLPDPDSAVVAQHSIVNLLTGEVTLFLTPSATGDVKMKLVAVQGYDRERSVNVYVGFTGSNTQTRRREIRAALRAWSDGIVVGGPIFGDTVSGVSASKSNITAVVEAITGDDTVQRVALGTPSSTDDRVLADETELLKIGTVYINNSVD
jgi:hypothetical protein